MVHINKSSGNTGAQSCQTDYLKFILENADKNNDGKVSIFELQDFKDSIKVFNGFSNNKNIQELFKAVQFAESNFQSLNKASNGGSTQAGIDVAGVDLVSQYDNNADNISLDDLRGKSGSSSKSNNIQNELMKFVKDLMNSLFKSILGKTKAEVKK